jgi:hypothetical protein
VVQKGPLHPWARFWLRVCQVVFTLFAINFLLFVGSAINLGGDAFNGYTRDGRYFLGMYGKYTEVTQEVFESSRRHAISVFVSGAITFVAAVWSQWLRKQTVKPRKWPTAQFERETEAEDRNEPKLD